MAVVELRSVVVDCNDLPGMSRFWQDALGYERALDHDDWVKLVDPRGSGATLSLQKVPEPRQGKNRLHVDLYASDVEAAIQHLTSVGASIHPRRPDPDDDFVVLEDPEGNLFCVIARDATRPS